MTQFQSIRRLETTDELDGFDCGVPVLNEWLKQFALSDQRGGSSVTYALVREKRVVRRLASGLGYPASGQSR